MNDNFKMVTAYSKKPLLLRTKYTMILSIIFISFLVYLYFIKSKYTNLVLLLFILLITILILYYRKYNNSLNYKIKNFIVENNLYNDVISAEIGYKVFDDSITIRFKKNADIFTDKASKYAPHFEALLHLPLKDIFNAVTYCDYLFDMYPDERLKLENIKVENNTIQLTKKISWKFGSPCHLLISGKTNSGKTYLATILILFFLQIKGNSGGSEIYVIDPKSADLSIICSRIDLKKYGRVKNLAITEIETVKLLREINDEMERRYKDWFGNDSDSFGKTWKDISLATPIVIIIDEFPALLSVAKPNIAKEILGYFNNLLLKGRMAGIEIVALMNRADISTNGISGLTGMQRDQFSIRIGMGNLKTDAKRMLFGNFDGELEAIKEIGAGYIMIDGQHTKPIYFEAPLLPKNSGDYLYNLDKAIIENMKN